MNRFTVSQARRYAAKRIVPKNNKPIPTPKEPISENNKVVLGPGGVTKREPGKTPMLPVRDQVTEKGKAAPSSQNPEMRRCQRVLRFGALDTERSSGVSNVGEEGFHHAMEQEPDEHLHKLAYADWLDEQGRPGQAAVLRSTSGSSASSGTYNHSATPEEKHFRVFHRSTSPTYGQHGINIAYPSGTTPRLRHQHSVWMEAGHAEDALKNLKKEGFVIPSWSNNETRKDTEELSRTEDPRDSGFGLEDPNFNKHMSRRNVLRAMAIHYGNQKKATGEVIHKDIKGHPYTLIPNEDGYGVTSSESKSDRFHRSYQVYCDESGNPTKCTCPDHIYRNHVCKHMQAVAELKSPIEKLPEVEDAPKPNDHKTHFGRRKVVRFSSGSKKVQEFQPPENYEKIRDLPGGEELWAGANDWEDAWTWASIQNKGDRPREGDAPKEWIHISHKDCPHCKGEINIYSGPKRKKCQEFAEKKVNEFAREFSSGDKVRKFAMAAPAGDMIVGHNNYKGGQHIPTKNGGEFLKAMMSPPKFNPVRMAAVRKRLKVHKVPWELTTPLESTAKIEKHLDRVSQCSEDMF